MNYEQCKTEFIKKASSIARNLHRYDVIRDFAEMARITIINNLTPFRNEDDEKHYLNIASKYSKDDLNEISHMLALVSLAYQNRSGDFLGECLMELEMGSKHMGQFFTPYDLCRMTAKITINPTDAQKQKGYFDISEPAAGGGAMIIAAQEIATQENIDMFASCVELNHMTADLCYINLSSAGIAAQVIQGNTLSMEMGRCMPTPALCSNIWTHRLAFKCNTDEIADRVYATVDNNESMDSGFMNMDQLINAMGEPFLTCSKRLVIYDGVAFTDYKVH